MLATRSWVNQCISFAVSGTRRYFNSQNYWRSEETIFEAIDSCRFKVLEEHLNRYPKSVKELACDRITPLHYLAGQCPWPGIRLPVEQEPKVEFAKLLIDRGASLHARNSGNLTPLDIAAKVGYFNLAKLFLDHGAEADEETLLRALVRSVNFDPYFRIEDILIEGAKGKINLKTAGPMLIAKVIQSVAWNLSIATNSLNPLYSDIKKIADAHFCVLDRKVEYLLERGVSADEAFEGATPVQRCFQLLDPCETGRIVDRHIRETLPVILDYTKNVGVIDKDSWTLLHWASFTGMANVVDSLLKRGLNSERTDLRGLSPRELSYLNMNTSLAKEEQLPKTVQELAKLSKKLPSEIAPSLQYWREPDPVEAITTKRSFFTGLFDVKGWLRSTPVMRQISALYTIDKKVTPMADAIQKKDLHQAQKLIEDGWNVHFENEFIAYFHFSRKTEKKDATMGFIKAFSKFEDPVFSLALLRALDASEASGVNCVTEFLSACYECADEKKILLILENGLTPEKFKSIYGKELKEFLLSWYYNHFNDEHGWHESDFFPSACRIIKAAASKGWVPKNLPFLDRYS
jgi:hypothetical protein